MLIKIGEKSSVIQKPIIKNGPNAIFAFNLLFCSKIAIIPITEPNIKLENNHTITLGKPSKNPKGIASLTSPNPMPFPLVIKFNKSKNNDAPNPLKSLSKKLTSGDIKNIPKLIKNKTHTNSSGII